MGTGAKSVCTVSPAFAVTAIIRIRRAAGGVRVIGNAAAHRSVAKSVGAPATGAPAICVIPRAAVSGGGRVNHRGAL